MLILGRENAEEQEFISSLFSPFFFSLFFHVNKKGAWMHLQKDELASKLKHGVSLI